MVIKETLRTSDHPDRYGRAAHLKDTVRKCHVVETKLTCVSAADINADDIHGESIANCFFSSLGIACVDRTSNTVSVVKKYLQTWEE